VGGDEAEGWYTDPYTRHEARWMSDGTPTSRVRDGRTEGFDPVTNDPFTVKPLRVKYLDHEPGAQSGGILKSKEGIAVPGGIVTIEPHLSRHDRVPVAKMLLQASTPSGMLAVQRDVVVWDEAHEHLLYRDGPYDSITVKRPLERIVEELNRVGVDAFVSSRGGGKSRIVFVERVIPGQRMDQAVLTGIGYYWRRFLQLFKRR
jgi:hypothetical protein